MRSPLNRINIIDIRIDMFTVTVIIHKRNFDRYIVNGIHSENIDRFWNQCSSAGIVIQHLQEFGNATLTVKRFCIKLSVFIQFATIIDDNSYTLVQKRQFPQTALQYISLIYGFD